MFTSKPISELPGRTITRELAISVEDAVRAIQMVQAGEAVELDKLYEKSAAARGAALRFKARLEQVEPNGIAAPGSHLSTMVWQDDDEHFHAVILIREGETPKRNGKSNGKPSAKAAKEVAKS